MFAATAKQQPASISVCFALNALNPLRGRSGQHEKSAEEEKHKHRRLVAWSRRGWGILSYMPYYQRERISSVAVPIILE